MRDKLYSKLGETGKRKKEFFGLGSGSSLDLTATLGRARKNPRRTYRTEGTGLVQEKKEKKTAPVCLEGSACEFFKGGLAGRAEAIERRIRRKTIRSEGLLSKKRQKM